MTKTEHPLSVIPEEWFQLAERTLRSARFCLKEGALEQAAFHAEWTADLYLQAFLVARGREPEFEPDLKQLLDEAEAQDPRFGSFVALCSKLAPHLEATYPPGLAKSVTAEELRADLDAVEKLGSLAQEIVRGTA